MAGHEECVIVWASSEHCHLELMGTEDRSREAEKKITLSS